MKDAFNSFLGEVCVISLKTYIFNWDHYEEKQIRANIISVDSDTITIRTIDKNHKKIIISKDQIVSIEDLNDNDEFSLN